MKLSYVCEKEKERERLGEYKSLFISLFLSKTVNCPSARFLSVIVSLFNNVSLETFWLVFIHHSVKISIPIQHSKKAPTISDNFNPVVSRFMSFCDMKHNRAAFSYFLR